MTQTGNSTSFTEQEKLLQEKFEHRFEKLFDHLEDGRDLTFFNILNDRLSICVDGKNILPDRFMISFYSPREIYKLTFCVNPHTHSSSGGCFELLREDERLVLRTPAEEIFCTGFKKDNSKDFVLFYFLESGEVCNFYISDPKNNIEFDVWNEVSSRVDFVSLYNFVQTTFEKTFNKGEVTYENEKENPSYDRK